MALFNMPLESTKDFGGGLKKDEFQKSVKMSTYLVAFIVCDYAHVTSKTSSGITVSYSVPFHVLKFSRFELKKLALYD